MNHNRSVTKSQPEEQMLAMAFVCGVVQQLCDLCIFKVLRYCKVGSPLWVSAEHVPSEEDVPECPCGAKRLFEFQVT